MDQNLLVPSDSTVELSEHHFLRKKIQTFTIDHLSRIISTYLSMYLEFFRWFIPWSKIFKGVFAQLSLIYLVLSLLNLSYPMVQDLLEPVSCIVILIISAYRELSPSLIRYIGM